MKKERITHLAMVVFALISLSACQSATKQVDDKIKQETLNDEAEASEAEAEFQRLEQNSLELDQVDSLLEGI